MVSLLNEPANEINPGKGSPLDALKGMYLM